MGITFAVLERWRGQPITKTDVRHLTQQEAEQIYFQWYWEPLHLRHIHDRWVKEFIFDWCVNAGLKNPVRQIQRLVGEKADGVIGPVTARAIESYLSLHLNRGYGQMVDHRVKWYIRLVESKHTRIVFMEGWFNRANEMRYSAPPYSNR